MICSVDGCTKTRKRTGIWCSMHSARMYRTGRFDKDEAYSGCSVEGCDKEHEAHTLCRKHYSELRRQSGVDAESRRGYLKKWGRTAKGRWTALKRAAKNTGLGTDISMEDHVELHSRPCFYCHGPLNPTGHALDRVQPKLGYYLGNVVPCCYPCNKIKSDFLTFEEMVVVAKALRDFRKGGSCGS